MPATTSSAAIASRVVVALFVVLGGCKTGETWELISTSDVDCFDIDVSPGGDDDDSAIDDDDSALDETSVLIDVHPVPGFFTLEVLGTARLTPPSGPAGTRFNIALVLVDTGADEGNPTTAVGRATVVADNGDVALDTLEMDPSPVDERLWTITVVAGGDPAVTTRQDRLCVGLYTGTE